MCLTPLHYLILGVILSQSVQSHAGDYFLNAGGGLTETERSTVVQQLEQAGRLRNIHVSVHVLEKIPPEGVLAWVAQQPQTRAADGIGLLIVRCLEDAENWQFYATGRDWQHFSTEEKTHFLKQMQHPLNPRHSDPESAKSLINQALNVLREFRNRLDRGEHLQRPSVETATPGSRSARHWKISLGTLVALLVLGAVLYHRRRAPLPRRFPDFQPRFRFDGPFACGNAAEIHFGKRTNSPTDKRQ